MNVKEYTTEISARLAMRSFFIYAFAASLIVNVILAFGLIVLDKKDRVVVLPAEITKSFWLDADGVSPEYLEQMGLFALQLALNNSPETFEHNQRKLLQYVSPDQRGATEVFLTAQGRRMKSANASVHMLPEAVETRASAMQVSVRGNVRQFIGDKLTSMQKKCWIVKFTYRNSRLWLETMQEADCKRPFEPMKPTGEI